MCLPSINKVDYYYYYYYYNVRKMLRILFSLLCITYIFFWFYRSVRFKANVEYTEKGITSAMECADVAGFTFVT